MLARGAADPGERQRPARVTRGIHVSPSRLERSSWIPAKRANSPFSTPRSRIVPVTGARMPSPTIPGLQAVSYSPGWDRSTWNERVSPGEMFSTSPTIRSFSA